MKKEELIKILESLSINYKERKIEGGSIYVIWSTPLYTLLSNRNQYDCDKLMWVSSEKSIIYKACFLSDELLSVSMEHNNTHLGTIYEISKIEIEN